LNSLESQLKFTALNKVAAVPRSRAHAWRAGGARVAIAGTMH